MGLGESLLIGGALLTHNDLAGMGVYALLATVFMVFAGLP